MNRTIITLLSIGLLSLVARAIPADPRPVQVTQPDGTTLTISLHGDEFYHFTTTIDDYTVVKDARGYYSYARLVDDRLVSSGRIARDAAQRSADDKAFLSTLSKRLINPSMVKTGQTQMSRRNSSMRRVGSDGLMDYDRFKGLIILVNYSDKSFSMNNPNSFYDAMVNTHDFKGYNQGTRFVSMTGSVRDYFYDNSNHIFDPSFDIVGPVNVDLSCTFPQSTTNSDQLFHQVLEAADPLVDFSKYDSDGDGYVDMVFFLVAGFSASYGGNNEDYLWPHMFYLYSAPRHDGKRFGLYACSTEISGWEGYGSRAYDIGGIGTFCHEFGHVLGLPDLYDTDYSGNGGESRHPEGWSIMAGGSGNNYGRNPVGYSLYERYALGFTTPTLIDQGGALSIDPLDVSNQGYRLNTKNKNEFFLIENRQSGKWDRNLPGHGMLIAKVDSTSERIWQMNEVNVNPQHMCYELLRANYEGRDGQGDPFPGNSGKTTITNFTTPSLLTWDKRMSEYIFENIKEQDGIINLNVVADTSIKTTIEEFELMNPFNDEVLNNVAGVFSNWDFNLCNVATLADGTQAVAMKKPSQITTSAPLRIKPYMVSFTFRNPTKEAANARMSYSADGGATWISLADGIASTRAGETLTVSSMIPTDAPVMLRITQTSGSSKSACYLDDIKVMYSGEWPVDLTGDVNDDSELSIADVNALINMIFDGTIHPRGDVNGDSEVNIADVNSLIDLLLKH